MSVPSPARSGARPPGASVVDRAPRWAAFALAAAIATTAVQLVLAWPPEPDVLAIAAGSIALDALAVATLLRRPGRRARTVVMAYAAVRALVAAAWWAVLATLPAYAAAAFLLALEPARRRRGRATGPHDFRSVADGWYGTGTPLGWSRGLVGAAQLGAQQCSVCGRSADDLLHAPPEPTGEPR